MLQKILFAITTLFTIALITFLNGDINIPGNPLPPLGKFLDPFKGAWASDNQNEKGALSIPVQGLKATVDVAYDERRVPHIYAQNIEDALYVQGYVEAQNRLFQMEFLARVAAGELSEIFGERTIEFDLEKRRRGMRYAAENAVKGWEKQPSYIRLQRYIDGVNAYISSLEPKDYPFEHKLFNLKPEPWTAVKTALIFKQMSLTLNGNSEDVKYTNLLHSLDAQDFADLYPEKQVIENPVIPKESKYQFDTIVGDKNHKPAIFADKIYKSYYDMRPKGVGSNSWGLSGSKTATGKPIFCNDPHLSLGLPSIWIEEHINTPDFNAYGVSFPGFPGIMIGFNDYIAWGETNVGQDVEDLMAIKWKDRKAGVYLLDNKEMKVDYRTELINVKGKKPISDTVRYTHWGPICATSHDGKSDLAMRWITHDVPTTDEVNTFIDALSCKSYDDYLRATEPYIAPAQNFGAADNKGNIGLRINGKLPAKHNGDGRFVKIGDASNNGWSGFMPKSQNPQIINPKRGFISSANQVSADASYPYYFCGRFERYRNATINGMLTDTKGASVDDMKRMQVSSYSLKADNFITVIKKVIKPENLQPAEKSLWEKLIAWDFNYLASKDEPTIFEIFYDKLEELTWDEITILKDTMDVRYPEDWRLLELIASKPDHKFFDMVSTKETKEKSTDIIAIALKATYSKVDSMRIKGQGISWGKYKPLNIFHLTRLPALSAMDIEANGCVDAINATGVSYGPSWRMIISLEDKPKGFAVFPGGQSGNPTSKYYKYGIDTWRKGEYFNLNNSPTYKSVKETSTQTIQFVVSK